MPVAENLNNVDKLYKIDQNSHKKKIFLNLNRLLWRWV